MRPGEIIDRAEHSHVAHRLLEQFGEEGLKALDENRPLIEETLSAAAKVLLVHHPLAAAAITAAVHAAADAIARHQDGHPPGAHPF